MTIRVGLIGAGLIAQWMHIPYIKEIEKYDLTSICDASEGLAKAVGLASNIPRSYSNHEEMLRKEELDAVIICAPDEYHDIICVDALEAGCNVMVEKPLALSVRAADRIVRASEKSRQKLMVGYMKRYDPGYNAAANIIKDMDDVSLIRAHDLANTILPVSSESIFSVIRGSLKKGPITVDQQIESKNLTEKLIKEQFGSNFRNKANPWRNLLGLGTHDMTVLRGIFGDPVRVIATTIVEGASSVSPLEHEYTIKIFSMLDYGKAKCLFEVGGTLRSWFDEEFTVFGNRQTTSIIWPFPWLKNNPSVIKTVKEKDGGFEESVTTYSYAEAFKIEHLHFIDCIENDQQPRTAGIEAKKDMEFLSAILAKA